MKANNLVHRISIWATICLMALNAVLPLANQAVAAQLDNTEWLEICSTTGMVRIKATTDTPNDSSIADLADKARCNYCALHNGVAILPTHSVAILFSPTFSHTQSLNSPANPRLTFWLTPLSRAPPTA